MSTLPNTFITVEDYLERDSAADFKSEYFDGEMFAMSGAGLPHDRIVWNIIGSLAAQLKDRPCRGHTSDMRVCIDRRSRYAYPDVTVVCGKPEFVDGRHTILTNPTLIIEVLSRSTEWHDRNFKRAAYAAIPTLRQYVLVSSLYRSVEVLTRTNEGAWVATQAYREGDAVTLASIDCRLEVDEVYANVDWPPAENA